MSHSTTVEANFDGLIGPSHNYAGLSGGNLASMDNAGRLANPRAAALQGLEKMRFLVRAGFTQGVLPPLPRPNLAFLAAAGFRGSDAQILQQAARTDSRLLTVAYSASPMWAANAATVSPSADTQDRRLHITVANLVTMLHRSIEHPDTLAGLRAIFGDCERFCVHRSLPVHPDFADEGAANHVRLCRAHADPGVELFVYGRDHGTFRHGFPARQTSLASACIARNHGLNEKRTVHACQSDAAIQAGAFHNDVVCVGALDTLFFHELAFAQTDAVLARLEAAADGLFRLQPVMVPDNDVPIRDAIASYLFNSQLLQWPDEERLVLLAPLEVQENRRANDYCQRLTASNGPIGSVRFVDVRQSMRNGGGPACLRLRVVLTPDERSALHPHTILTETKIDTLQTIVQQTFRDRVCPGDLADPAFADECRTARETLLRAMNLEVLA